MGNDSSRLCEVEAELVQEKSDRLILDYNYENALSDNHDLQIDIEQYKESEENIFNALMHEKKFSQQLQAKLRRQQILLQLNQQEKISISHKSQENMKLNKNKLLKSVSKIIGLKEEINNITKENTELKSKLEEAEKRMFPDISSGINTIGKGLGNLGDGLEIGKDLFQGIGSGIGSGLTTGLEMMSKITRINTNFSEDDNNRRRLVRKPPPEISPNQSLSKNNGSIMRSNAMGIGQLAYNQSYLSDQSYLSGSDTPLPPSMNAFLDHEFDIDADVEQIHEYLENKKYHKRLALHLAELLTARTSHHRSNMSELYQKEYKVNMKEDIHRVMSDTKVADIIGALLKTTQEYVAELLYEAVCHRDIPLFAELLCTQTIPQLKDIAFAYKKAHKAVLGDQLKAVAEYEGCKTAGEIIRQLFEYTRVEDQDPDVYKISDTVHFMRGMKKFKGKDKTKLCCIFVNNNALFLRLLNQEWVASIGKLENLDVFIDQKLGSSSIAGKFCKIRLQYSLDSNAYFASQIKDLGINQNAISRVIISRFEYDLDLIQRKFNTMKYGGERTLVEWLDNKGNSSNVSVFLCKMLDNCERYIEYQDLHGHKKAKKSKLHQMF